MDISIFRRWIVRHIGIKIEDTPPFNSFFLYLRR